jgi:outer membrane protein assembly factor BamB
MFIETYGGYFKTGKQLVALNKSNLSVAWTVMDGGIGNGSPCYVTSGTTQRVYTAIDHGVACYNATNGAPVWKSSTLPTPWTLTYDVAASLTYDGGNLYVTTNDLATYSGKGQIICVDAATGAWKWAAPKTIGWVSVPPVVINGKVYVKGGNSTHLWCFDAATGAQVFDKALGGNSFATCLAAAQNKLYMTDGSKLMILDPANGNPLGVLGDKVYDGPVALDARGGLYAHAGGALRAFGQTVPVTISAFSAE